MTRRSRTALLAVLAAVGVAVGAAAQAATYNGVVGPGKTIKLTKPNGARVTTIPAGRHTFVIRDRARTHNFVLKRGATVINRTGIGATGTFNWRRVLMRTGTHTFYCATHAREMRGTFRVR
jgi:plastocyanin